MSETSAGDDPQERADHEAGHYVIAKVIGPICGVDVRHAWVTIEPRLTSGGSCGTRWAKPPIQFAVYHRVAGLIAQVTGVQARARARDEPEEFPLDRIYGQAASDLSVLIDDPEYDGSSFREVFVDCRRLVLENWEKILLISGYLQKCTTLFEDEADFISRRRIRKT